VKRIADLLFTYLPPDLTAGSAQLRVSRLLHDDPLQQEKYAKEQQG
jgi:hypothetical protein